MMQTNELPHYVQLAEQTFDLDLDILFEFGLGRLLDGIETFVRQRG